MIGTIKVTCNNPNCCFIGTYHNTTIESIKAHRNLMLKIPCIDGECPHADVTIIEVD